MGLKEEAIDAWCYHVNALSENREVKDQEACESAIRSFVRLTGCQEVPTCWVEEGRTRLKYDGIIFSHARKPHTWWMWGTCPECGKEGWSASFGEDGFWYVGQILEEFEVAGHTCPVEEVEEPEEEPTAAEQLKEAVLRVMRGE